MSKRTTCDEINSGNTAFWSERAPNLEQDLAAADLTAKLADRARKEQRHQQTDHATVVTRRRGIESRERVRVAAVELLGLRPKLTRDQVADEIRSTVGLSFDRVVFHLKGLGLFKQRVVPFGTDFCDRAGKENIPTITTH